jgi:hypothetical protein
LANLLVYTRRSLRRTRISSKEKSASFKPAVPRGN